MSNHERDWVLLALGHNTRRKGYARAADVVDTLRDEFGWNPEEAHIAEVLESLSSSATKVVRKSGELYRISGNFHKRVGII